MGCPVSVFKNTVGVVVGKAVVGSNVGAGVGIPDGFITGYFVGVSPVGLIVDVTVGVKLDGTPLPVDAEEGWPVGESALGFEVAIVGTSVKEGTVDGWTVGVSPVGFDVVGVAIVGFVAVGFDVGSPVPVVLVAFAVGLGTVESWTILLGVGAFEGELSFQLLVVVQ